MTSSPHYAAGRRYRHQLTAHLVNLAEGAISELPDLGPLFQGVHTAADVGVVSLALRSALEQSAEEGHSGAGAAAAEGSALV